MVTTEQSRVQQLEDSLKDILQGCQMMLAVEHRQSVRAFILEVQRVASAPFGGIERCAA